MLKKYSFFSWLATCLFIIVTACCFYPKWNQTKQEATIGYDVAGYYLYLPAIFIYHDITHLNFADSIWQQYTPTSDFYQGDTLENGNRVCKYPIGAAVMYAPGFFSANLLAQPLGYKKDGFSKPYQVALSFICILYACLGLFFFRKILLYYFSDITTSVCILLAVTATNYLNYTAIDHAMTHNLLFTVYALIIYYTIQLYATQKLRYAGILGLLCGLATIIRPTEIVCCLIPAFWGIKNTKDIKARFHFFISHYLKLIVYILSACSIGFLQLIYWKYVSGNWFVYSYGDQNFSWLHPHIINGLFSYKKGWFIYTPFMLLIIPGFVYLYKQHKQLFPVTLLFTVLAIYIVLSWDIWWYGGSLGQRALVQGYCIMFFPIAACIEQFKKFTLSIRIIFIAWCLFCVWYNCLITWQAHSKSSMFEAEMMNKAYFWKIFGKTHFAKDDRKYLDTNEIFHGEKKYEQTVYFNNFETNSVQSDTTHFISGHASVYIDKERPYSPACEIKNITSGATWLNVSASFYAQEGEWDLWHMPQFAIQFKNNTEQIKWSSVRIFRLLTIDEWQTINFDVKIPDTLFNSVTVFLWNADSDKKVYMDDVKVVSFH